MQVTISIFRFYFIIGPFIFRFSHAGLATFGGLVLYSPFKDYFYFLYVFILAVPCEYGFYFQPRPAAFGDLWFADLL